MLDPTPAASAPCHALGCGSVHCLQPLPIPVLSPPHTHSVLSHTLVGRGVPAVCLPCLSPCKSYSNLTCLTFRLWLVSVCHPLDTHSVPGMALGPSECC